MILLSLGATQTMSSLGERSTSRWANFENNAYALHPRFTEIKKKKTCEAHYIKSETHYPNIIVING